MWLRPMSRGPSDRRSMRRIAMLSLLIVAKQTRRPTSSLAHLQYGAALRRCWKSRYLFMVHAAASFRSSRVESSSSGQRHNGSSKSRPPACSQGAAPHRSAVWRSTASTTSIETTGSQRSWQGNVQTFWLSWNPVLRAPEVADIRVSMIDEHCSDPTLRRRCRL